MKQRNRIFWGLCFIVAALVLAFSQFGIFSRPIGVGQIILGFLYLAILIGGIRERNFFGIFLAVGLFWVTFGKLFDLPRISFGMMLVVVIILSIGFQFLFPKKKQGFYQFEKGWDGNSYNGEYQKVTDENQNGYVHYENQFGSLAKYVNIADFKGGDLKNTFGELKVYFDQATILNSPIEIRVDNSFGSTELYIPKFWNVRSDVSVFLGECKESYPVQNADGPVVSIVGNVSFGEVKIIYI